jgi:hypothetical protein
MTDMHVWAIDVFFKAVADGIYAYVGEIEGRTYDKKGLTPTLLIWKWNGSSAIFLIAYSAGFTRARGTFLI